MVRSQGAPAEAGGRHGRRWRTHVVLGEEIMARGELEDAGEGVEEGGRSRTGEEKDRRDEKEHTRRKRKDGTDPTSEPEETVRVSAKRTYTCQRGNDVDAWNIC